MKNILHLEDAVFFLSSDEIRELASALLIHLSGTNTGSLNIKYDGAPALVFGNREGFFLSNKSYFNKEPVYYRSIEEIKAAGLHPDHEDKLVYAFRTLKGERIFPDLVLYADWLFDMRTLNVEDEKTSFQPNVIEYSRRGLGKYVLGLAVHSQAFCGMESASRWTPISPKIYHAPVHLSDLEMPTTALFSMISQIPDYETLSLQEARAHQREMNRLVREYSDYSADNLLNFDENMRKAIDSLAVIKYCILGYLDKRGNKDSGLTMKIGDEPTTHEGFVFRYKHYKIKLVDRFRFSKKNFDPETRRGWTRAMA